MGSSEHLSDLPIGHAGLVKHPPYQLSNNGQTFPFRSSYNIIERIATQLSGNKDNIFHIHFNFTPAPKCYVGQGLNTYAASDKNLSTKYI